MSQPRRAFAEPAPIWARRTPVSHPNGSRPRFRRVWVEVLTPVRDDERADASKDDRMAVVLSAFTLASILLLQAAAVHRDQTLPAQTTTAQAAPSDLDAPQLRPRL